MKIPGRDSLSLGDVESFNTDKDISFSLNARSELFRRDGTSIYGKHCRGVEILKNPHEKDKAPFLTVGDFSYDRRKKLSRALRRNPARSACTLKRPKGVVWDMPVNDSRASENAPDFSKNGNIFCLSVSRMEWRIYAAWHRASGFSYAARLLLRVRRARAPASSP